MRFCAANHCGEATHHPEVEFCSRHWRMLPRPHRKKMFEQRPEASRTRVAGPDYQKLRELGQAICVVREGHTYRRDVVDEGGFDWIAGLPVKTLAAAKKVCDRFDG